MKKINRYVLLPVELIQRIESIGLTKKQKDKAKKLVNIMLNRANRDSLLMSEYMALPQEYLQKVFGKYHPWFSKLKAEGVIQTNHKYSTGDKGNKAFSKSYRINADLLTSNFVSGSYVEELHICSTVFNKELVTSDLKQLKINRENLIQLTNQYAESISIEDFKVNHQIDNDFFEVIDRKYGSKRFTTLERAIEVAEKRGMAVIKDRNKYYIDCSNEFIKEKKKAVRFHYGKAVDKLDKKIYYVHRNDTNNRLDTNITNLCELLTNQIMDDNDLCSLDLSNSQFAIFCYLYEQMGNTQTLDYLSFKRLAVAGELYEDIADKLELPSRREAKSLMFELFFSSHRYNPKRKQELKKYYPTVVGFIDDYKKEHGDNMFAVGLQIKESEMFIDNIYSRIKEGGVFCLTKHDSVIVRREDRHKAREIMEDYFSEIEFQGKLKLEHEEPKWLEELREKISQMEYNDMVFYLSNLAVA